MEDFHSFKRNILGFVLRTRYLTRFERGQLAARELTLYDRAAGDMLVEEGILDFDNMGGYKPGSGFERGLESYGLSVVH